MLVLLFLLILRVTVSSSLPFFPTNFSSYDPDSVSRLIDQSGLPECVTGNPIDDCWLCSPTDWRVDLFRLADCAVGFGSAAAGGKSGRIYTVNDSSDSDPVNPILGTLRYAAIQSDPLWIIFAFDMSIRLKEELFVNSFKTIDGRGADVHIAGGACIAIQQVSNVIIHNLHIHDCVPSGNAAVRTSPSDAEFRGRSDGDGITIWGARDVWIDHCALSNCSDGLIDATMGSTAITISNSYFTRHDKVMLLGHSDNYTADSAMKVTVAFNRFGEKLGQRMPRCRHGYFHIVNNDYMGWELYAVGGSANPTINSQGNRYKAPFDPDLKQVTMRLDTDEKDSGCWNWRSDGDLMLDGAFFVPSGETSPAFYENTLSFEPKPSALIDQLTRNVGVICGPRGVGVAMVIVGGEGAGGDEPSSAVRRHVEPADFRAIFFFILFLII